MKLDLTVIKNESINRFDKALKNVKNVFDDMLSIALDTSRNEFDQEKRQEVEVNLSDILNDEFSIYKTAFIKCMNKCSVLVETNLSC